MASTTHLALNKPDFRDKSWHTPVNANWDKLDQKFGGAFSANLATGDVVLTATGNDNFAYNVLSLTGALPTDRSLTIPAIGGSFVVQNNCTLATTATGSPQVTLTATGGGSLVLPLGKNAHVAFTATGGLVELGQPLSRFLELWDRANGDSFQGYNIEPDGSGWFQRKDTTKVGWMMSYMDVIPGEVEGGLIFWLVQPSGATGALGLATWAAVGGPELAFGITDSGNIVLKAFGIEYDGNGTVPYWRTQWGRFSNLATATGGIGPALGGMLYNAYLDYSGTDRQIAPSLFFGMMLASGQLTPHLVGRYAPPTGTGAGTGSTVPDFHQFFEVDPTDINEGKSAGLIARGTLYNLNPLANGTFIFGHGLTGVPDVLKGSLICTATGDFGYQVGDRIVFNGQYGTPSDGTTGGISMKATATGVVILVAAGIGVNNNNTGAVATNQVITATRWRLEVEPFQVVDVR